MKINWGILFFTFIFISISLFLGHEIYFTESDTVEFIAFSVICFMTSVMSLFCLLLAFFEKRMMNFMYGEFSNRNLWGR